MYVWYYKIVTIQNIFLYAFPIILIILGLFYIFLGSKFPQLQIGGDYIWEVLLNIWGGAGTFVDLNEYFFSQKYGGYIGPLIGLIIPLIVFKKMRKKHNLVLIEIMYVLLFLNAIFGCIFYKRLISDLDLFTAINLGIILSIISNYLKSNIKNISRVKIINCLVLIILLTSILYPIALK